VEGIDEMLIILFKAMKKEGIQSTVDSHSIQGKQGFTIIGDPGEDGADGTPGPTGLTGFTGPQGPIGLTGDEGVAGEDGVPGVAGIIGAQGPPGNPGSPGVAGAAGIGIQGIDGDPGEDGIPGTPGTAGVAGAAGAQGATGLGIPGTDGEDGLDGTPGPIGLQGIIGPQGPQGLGVPGIDGEDGDTWQQGRSSVPSTGTGLAVLADSPALTTSPTAPTQSTTDNSTKLATTAFVTTAVSNALAGVNPAVAVEVASAAILPNTPTYNNGVSGIGAFITTVTTNTALVVDGYTPILGDRVLVKNEGDTSGLGAAKNGVYAVTQLAAIGLAWILTRALDYDMPSDINNTGAIPVENHGSNTLTSWLLTSLVTAVGTDALTYVQFSLCPPSEVTITTTGNIDDLDFAHASTIRMNNSTLATLRGLKAGIAGQQVAIVSVGAGEVDCAHQNAGSTAPNRLINTVTSGITPLAPGIGVATYTYDATTARWRLTEHRQGAKIDTPYVAGNFTGDGAMTWTVDVGDVVLNSYLLDGNILEWSIRLASTTVGGTPDFGLRATQPNGYTNIGTDFRTCMVGDNTSAYVMGACRPSNTTYIQIIKDLGSGGNWAASTNNTFILFQIRVPIS
jgi:hypothetical protein